jgi:quinoprotein dehydrogenase-associated probable ABC transporter substrate-binding protein
MTFFGKTLRAATCFGAALLVASGCARAQASAPEQPPKREAFRVCQDPNNLPFSNTQGEGIENKIAEVFAKALGLPVTYYSFPQRLAFIRNTLRYKLPGEDYPCDIVMGVPVGFDQVSVTKPYYRSTYALVFPKGKGMDEVKSGDDFLHLDRKKLESLRIGVYDRSPASDWLARHKLTDQGVPYRIMNADPAQYPGQIIEDDLAGGKIDAAIVWGPIAGFFAKRVKSPQLEVVPLKSEPGIKLDYQMAMGVRYGERAWKQQIEQLIDAKRPEIQAILKEYGVPLVDASYAAPQN